MANSFNNGYFKQYIDLLDEVYKASSKTTILDGNPELVSAGSNAKEIVIPKLSMDGLGDYSRNGGYVGGDVTLTNETVTCNFDRGRAFTVDAMDNAETAGVAFGRLSAEFIRTKVVPELDAFRFATYCGTSGISKVDSGATLSSASDVVSALIVAQNKMDEDEVSEEGRILFITPTLLRLVQNMDTTKSREVLDSFASVVTVPQNRFYTAITQSDGTTEGQTAGGYAKAVAGKDINFLVVQKDATIQFQKHVVNKIISPEENQTSDGWKFCFRDYGIADVYDNKVAGIYLHHKA